MQLYRLKVYNTENVINAYLKHVYASFSDSKYILSDRGGEFSRKQFTWLAKKLGFTKVFTSLFTPVGNSINERTHSFLKVSLRKITRNHNTHLDSLAHKAVMAYNMFPHSSSGAVPFYLMFGWDAYMPTLFKLLLPKNRYMGDRKCRIHLDAVREIYMMTVLNLKTTEINT